MGTHAFFVLVMDTAARGSWRPACIAIAALYSGGCGKLAAHSVSDPACEVGDAGGIGDRGDAGACELSGRVLAAGSESSCALSSDGVPTCWGRGFAHPPVAPTGLVTTLAASGNRVCGLGEDGRVVCLGTYEGEEPRPLGEEHFTAISVTDSSVCGLPADGLARCDGSHKPPAATRFVALAGGGSQHCGLQSDGTAQCWGPAIDEYDSEPPASKVFAQVTVGDSHGCGLQADGLALCWGDPSDGQLDVPQGARFRALAAGEGSTCGIQLDASIVCWGRGPRGSTRAPIGNDYVALAVGSRHVCAARLDGAVRCAGIDGPGWSTRTMPDATDVTAIVSGDGFACAVDATHQVHCWGMNTLQRSLSAYTGFASMDVAGTFGCGVSTSGRLQCFGAAVADEWLDGDAIAQVATSLSQVCALRADGSVHCWKADFADYVEPAAGSPSGTFTHLSAGVYSICGLRTDGAAVCWGGADPVVTNDVFESLDVGGYTACGLRGDATARCWPMEGGHGVGAVDSPPGKYLQVVPGVYHACGLRLDHTVVCWPLGVGTFTQEEADMVPTGRLVELAGGWYHHCGLRPDGTVECWSDDQHTAHGSPPNQFFGCGDLQLPAQPPGHWPEICGDRRDNDGDGATDCDDTDCVNTRACKYCGNGVIDEGEVCDDGSNRGGYAQCDWYCRALGPHCGDGIVQAPEQCDAGEGNSDTTPGACSTACSYPGR